MTIITCTFQSTGVVTMVMEVLHNSCNMCTCDLPDNVVIALGMNVRQIAHAHLTTISTTNVINIW